MADADPSRAPACAHRGIAVAESARKAELAGLLLEYSAAHGLSNMSLRPLAAAVGSSPRVLLYFFGSKEGLIREVLTTSRARLMELVEQALGEEKAPGRGSMECLWQWMKDPAQADMARLFFESYGRSLSERDGAWADFGKDSVAEWLPFIARMLSGDDGQDEPARGTTAATLALAVLRGLLLDLIATGDNDRVQGAFDLFCDIFLARARQPGP